MQDIATSVQFIDLTVMNVGFLFVVGFVGGMVSGFIGSGGAFVLTPAMMSLGVPGTVAVASNMCHKFPKALVGAHKRHKYGQVDIKLGVIMGLRRARGAGRQAVRMDPGKYGQAGTNLYVTVVFVVVLVIVGGYVLRDAMRPRKAAAKTTAEPASGPLGAVDRISGP